MTDINNSSKVFKALITLEQPEKVGFNNSRFHICLNTLDVSKGDILALEDNRLPLLEVVDKFENIYTCVLLSNDPLDYIESKWLDKDQHIILAKVEINI